MKTEYEQMIPGAGASKESLFVYSPYDELELGRVGVSNASQISRALDNALNLYQNKKNSLSLKKRLDILETLAVSMHQKAEDIAMLASMEGGKPLNDSLVEVNRAIDGIRACIETMRTQAGSAIPMNLNAASAHKIAFTRLEASGVVMAYSAFNHPVNLIVHQVVTAIAAGCPVLVKPSESTPMSCFQLVEMLRESGLPEDWCQPFAINDLAIAQQLVSDKRINYFSFIGNATVGWKLRSQLAEGTRCALEHGGVAPVIVLPDAPLDLAVSKITKGAYYHAGQVCVSVQRVFVHEKMQDDFLARLLASTQGLKIGDPVLKNTEVGPLIKSNAVKRAKDWVNEAIGKGAKLITGGYELEHNCFECTILLNPPDTAKVSQLEIFGPVVCVYTFNDVDKAIQRANSLPYAFQAAVFTKDIDQVLGAFTKLDAATVILNDHTAFRVDWMPFGGLKKSGLGVGGIKYAIRDMQNEKLLVLHSPEL